jgi:hypothetical protein
MRRQGLLASKGGRDVRSRGKGRVEGEEGEEEETGQSVSNSSKDVQHQNQGFSDMLRSCSTHGIAGDKSPAATTDWGHLLEGNGICRFKGGSDGSLRDCHSPTALVAF